MEEIFIGIALIVLISGLSYTGFVFVKFLIGTIKGEPREDFWIFNTGLKWFDVPYDKSNIIHRAITVILMGIISPLFGLFIVYLFGTLIFKAIFGF